MYAVRPRRYYPANPAGTAARTEPVWRQARLWQLQQPLPAWLLDRGSLTRQLLASSDGHFAVRIRHQQWQRPRPSERRLLGLRPRSWALVREVELHCRGQAWVFARSVLPATSLQGRLRHLRRFGSRSLGEQLFTDRSMRRRPFEVTAIEHPGPGLPADLFQPGHRHWGRRCRFELAGQPIMVSEIFLAAFQPPAHPRQPDRPGRGWYTRRR